MKIICVGMNYAEHNKELNHSIGEVKGIEGNPTLFLKPDTAIGKEGWPFFVPEFSNQVEYETEVVVRISRLGRCIPTRFAHRYYNEITLGIDFTARDLQRRLREAGQPWEVSKGFDGAAVVGEWRPVEAYADVQRLHFGLHIDGRPVQAGCTDDMLFRVDELIAWISRFYTLKTGDLLYTGTPAGVGPVEVGQHLQGYLEGEKLLDFYVR